MKKIRLFKPSVGVEELNNIKKVFRSNWLGYGPIVAKFEKKLAKFIMTDRKSNEIKSTFDFIELLKKSRVNF